MLRHWVLGGLGGVLLASVVCWGRPGTVKTRDGQTFNGEVAEQDDQVVVDERGIHLTIPRSRIQSLSYADTIEQAYQKRLARLTRYDVPGRLELAHWLFDQKAYELARGLLEDTRAIQPHNADVVAMIKVIERQEDLERAEARRHAPVELAAADPNPRAAAGEAPPAGAARPKARAGSIRLLTPEEIQVVRQAEWKGPEERVSVRFMNDVRRKYVARQGVEPATFNRETPPRQAWAIIHNGTPAMRKDVILGDPPELQQFKLVQRSLLANCATCHSGQKVAGNFALVFPPTDDAATYTNFMILQKYTQKGDKPSEPAYPMINRERPGDSLLVQYALPPDAGNPPHPKDDNYRGAVRTRNAPPLKATEDWISGLNPVAPDYGDIDLSAAAPTTRPARQPTAPPQPPARGQQQQQGGT